MFVINLLTQDHALPMCLTGRSTEKQGAANDSTTEVALETKTILTPKKSAIKDALRPVTDWS